MIEDLRSALFSMGCISPSELGAEAVFDTAIMDCMVEYPRRRTEQEDFDGFGVLYCESCSYCKHATIYKGKCAFCGKSETELETKS